MLTPLSKRIVLALLMFLVLGYLGTEVWRHLRAAAPSPPELPGGGALSRIQRLRQLDETLSLGAVTNLAWAPDPLSPLFANPSPPPAPAPPPPSSAKIELLYQGHYVTSAGERRAYVQAGDRLVIGPAGTEVAAGYAIADIALRQLKLKDAAGSELVLEFNQKKSVEVPLNRP